METLAGKCKWPEEFAVADCHTKPRTKAVNDFVDWLLLLLRLGGPGNVKHPVYLFHLHAAVVMS